MKLVGFYDWVDGFIITKNVKYYFYEDDNNQRKVEYEFEGNCYEIDKTYSGFQDYKIGIQTDFFKNHVRPWLRGIDDKAIMKSYFSYKQKPWYKKIINI